MVGALMSSRFCVESDFGFGSLSGCLGSSACFPSIFGVAFLPPRGSVLSDYNASIGAIRIRIVVRFLGGVEAR